MNFKKYRELAGLTQAQAAEKLGISTDSVRRYETGFREPRATDLKHMAELYGCTADMLLKSAEGVGNDEPDL